MSSRRGRGGRSRALATSDVVSLPLILVYLMWALVIFDVHRWLGAIGPSAFSRAQTLLYLALFVAFLVRGPKTASWLRWWMVCPPLLAFVLVTVAAVPGAIAVGKARDIAQGMVLFYLLVLGTLIFVRRPRQTIPILLMFPLQYLWWAFHGNASGVVRWHPAYGNFDGFGALMVLGIGTCFYFALATKSKWLKRLSFFLTGYCVLGVIASEARGAFLAMALVGLAIWIRSPRKMLASGVLVLGFVIVLVGSSLLHPEGSYWQEIRSVFVEGTEEGTGGHRWVLWKAAFKVFLGRPIFGAGGANFGVYVVEVFGYEEVGYGGPGRLVGRNLHSIYVQILSEFGAAGSLAFLWLVVDFWKRNRALRSPPFLRAWAASTGGDLDLRHLSFALELAMIAFLATGAVYAQLYHNWLYTLVGANLVLYATLYTGGGRASRRRVRRSARAGESSRAPVPALMR